MPEGMTEPVSDETLNEREERLLQALADGKTLQEAASEIGVAYQSAKQISYRIHGKLEVVTTYHAIATALRRGIID